MTDGPCGRRPARSSYFARAAHLEVRRSGSVDRAACGVDADRDVSRARTVS